MIRELGTACAMIAALAVAGVAHAQSEPAADLILTNGKVVTLDGESDIAQAVAVRDGKVVAVGSAADIDKFKGGSTRTIDLKGRTMIPGLQDSHVHVSGIGATTFTDAPIGDARSIAEVLDIISKAVAKKQPGEWITVSGDLRHTRIKERRYPTRAELDKIAPNNPVLVPTGHLSTANSMALKLAGIQKGTPQPTGGLIRFDSHGEPTGVLEERAAGLVSRLIPEREVDMGEAILAAQRKLAALGFTTVREPGVSHDVLEAYRKLDAENRLIIRSSVLLRPRGLGDDAVKQIESWAPDVGTGDDMMRVWGIKLGVDGGLVLTNAGLMRQPYLDKPGYRGVQTVPTEDFNRIVSAANRVGFAVGVHATGDAGMELVADAFEKASAEKDIRGRRFSIEHADMPTEKSMAAMKELQVVASIQPSMLTTAPAVLRDQLGADRIAGFLPFQTYRAKGIIMAGGSDASAFEVNPYHGIWSMVTRRMRNGDVVISGDQRVTREEALKTYIQGGAYLTFDEKVKGSIEPGKFADFTVLTKDILTCPEDDIAAILPVMTIVGGKVVYEAPSGS